VEPAAAGIRLLRSELSLFNSAIFFKNLLSWDYFLAALTTLWISIASLLLGLVVGLALAVARDSGIAVLGAIAKAYLWLFRGTPVLLQIVFSYRLSASYCRASHVPC